MVSDVTLIEAVKGGDCQQVEAALTAGADVNAPGSEQEWTALTFAAGKGNLEMVKLLVAGGADVFKTGRDNRTPYKIAVAAGHAAVARYLAVAEAKAGGDTERTSSRESETRPYCKAYHLEVLHRFAGWPRRATNGSAGAQTSGDDDVVFLHQDFTVTQSMFHGEDVLLGEVTPEWRAFCTEELLFKVPDDFDLMPAKESSDAAPRD